MCHGTTMPHAPNVPNVLDVLDVNYTKKIEDPEGYQTEIGTIKDIENDEGKTTADKGLIDNVKSTRNGKCQWTNMVGSSYRKEDRDIVNDENNGIVVVYKMYSKKENKERRIVVSDNRRYHMNDRKICNLPKSSRKVQNIECANKQQSGFGIKMYEVVDIRADYKHMNIAKTIDNERNNLIFNSEE
ncbi:17951_t:CDS:2, partial [Gigaspora rosea]